MRVAALPLTLLAIALIAGGPVPSGAATPDLTCQLVPIHLSDPRDVDLGGRYRLAITPVASGEFSVSATALVLDRSGSIRHQFAVAEGDLFDIRVRDNIFVQHVANERRWLVDAPGLLVRVEIRQGFRSGLAYAGAYASIRIDRPSDLVFAATPGAPDAPVHLTIGVSGMDPATIHLLLDCVDIGAAIGGQFPGGPFQGDVAIDGQSVRIEDLRFDETHGRLDVTVKGLPGGAYKVHVDGQPDYLDRLPPGASKWARPLGALTNDQVVNEFRVQLIEPAEGEVRSNGPVTVRGRFSHGLPVDKIRVNGHVAQVHGASVRPGDDCHGPAYLADFTTVLQPADLLRDFRSGDDGVGAVDPGANFVTAVGTDSARHAASDRHRWLEGPIRTGLTSEVTRTTSGVGHSAVSACDVPQLPPGFVESGIGTVITGNAIRQAVRNALQHPLRALADEKLRAIHGVSLRQLFAGDFSCPLAVATSDPARVRSAPLSERSTVSPADPSLVARLREIRLRVVGALEVPVANTVGLQLVADDFSNPGARYTYSMTGAPDDAVLDGDRFAWLPDCADIGEHVVTFTAKAGLREASETVTIRVTNGTTHFEDEWDLQFGEVVFDTSKIEVGGFITGTDAHPLVRTYVDTRGMEFPITASGCIADWLGICWLGVEIPFTVAIDHVIVNADLTPEQLVCGLNGESPALSVDLDNADIDVTFGAAWFTGPLGFFADVLGFEFFMDILLQEGWFIQEVFLDDLYALILSHYLDDFYRAACASGDCFPVLDLNYSLPNIAGFPLDLSSIFDGKPVASVTGSGGAGDLVLQFGSGFIPRTSPDPAPPWTFSGAHFQPPPTRADVVVGISNDFNNQMFSALTTTGSLRGRFEGFTLSDLAGTLPAATLDKLLAAGIAPSTPVMLSLDAVHDAAGNAVPPFIVPIDDPGTPDVELLVRTQLLVRGVISKGQVVGDDRQLCNCMDPRPECGPSPCLLFEDVLRLNLVTRAGLRTNDAGSGIDLVVDAIQQLVREQGYSAFESVDLSAGEGQIVSTSAQSPLLEALRQRLNTSVPRLELPMHALNLGGLLEPKNLRLVAWHTDGAGPATADFIALAADVEERPVPIAVRTAAARASLPSRVGPGVSVSGEGPRPAIDAAAASPVAPTVQAAPIRRPLQIQPNPVRAGQDLTCSFEVDARRAHVDLRIFDIAGREVAILARGVQSPGRRSVRWDGMGSDGRPAANGIYLVRLVTGGEVHSARFVKM